ncbi:hypothetical protein EXIGLDRAFT_520131 [Exidia glandulosa HHB12029]|uniref:Uncharacterized protein n=1 Tax=Exidia glandulosa HHB12029 TaxID=1314781 RepID=A0A165J5V0_EXIGL|nr:hypothetical protein EXIGLDRAFT_520131 [Exidia glandulosa HHB12029]
MHSATHEVPPARQCLPPDWNPSAMRRLRHSGLDWRLHTMLISLARFQLANPTPALISLLPCGHEATAFTIPGPVESCPKSSFHEEVLPPTAAVSSPMYVLLVIPTLPEVGSP